MAGPEEAKYHPLPALSPYSKSTRYSSPKEEHKFFEQTLRKRVSIDAPLNVVDVGCANGELLYLLKQKYPHWKLSGIDITPEFIEVGRNFDGLAGVDLAVTDLFEEVRTFDLVLCDGTLQIFPDVEPPLKQLVKLCRPGGHIFATGRFNRFDIEVRLQYCDNSNDQAWGIWRADWNQHSQKSIFRLLESEVEAMEFIEVRMDKDLPLNPEMPINIFSFRDADGKNILTNGVNLILNKTMLVVKK